MRRSLLVTALGAAILVAGCTAEQIGQGLKSGFRYARAGKPFTWKEELEIGGTVAARLAASYEIAEDPRATEYVNMVASTVSSYGERPDVLPRLLILRSEVPNAYACPGGYMFVTTGLLKTCRDESELAGVLGHELVHVGRKHTLAMLRKKRRRSCFLEETAKNLADRSEIARHYPGFKSIVDAGIDGIVNNNHGRKVEAEADRLGAEWAARAGYDPAGLGRLIERLPVEGKKSAWKEKFSVYKDGSTRAQHIAKELAKKGITGGGVRNAERYRRELAGILK